MCGERMQTGRNCDILHWMQRLSQAKLSKIASVFLKEKNICYKMVYNILYKLEFT